MTSRLHRLDRIYRKRMTVAVPGAVLFLGLSMVLVPADRFFEPSKRVAQAGPLQILPQIDIVTDVTEDRQLTAAPQGAPAADFLVIDFDYAESPRFEPPPPEPSPAPREFEDETPESSPLDDVQTDIRTTGHPVLAEAEYELIYLHRPVYPREAIRREIEGEILIMMLVDTNGRVARTRVLNPDQFPLLEQSAVEAVKRSLFKPHYVDGKPTAFWIRVPIEFRLVK